MYRTKTYIAADWDNDKDAVDILYKWNNSDYWSLDFHDAHEITKARDSSLPCSIKASLKKRMDISKTFVLIVGNHTDNITKGRCMYCQNRSLYNSYCSHGTYDYRSYIEYECDEAIKADIKIVVLYKSTIVNRSKCPLEVRYTGTHIAMQCRDFKGDIIWNYPGIKEVLN